MAPTENSLQPLFFTVPASRTQGLLDRLESLRIHYIRRLSASGAGPHLSPKAGLGTEFREFRDYAQGDDMRHLDWKLTARFARPYIRTFQDERSRFVHFVLDASQSMVHHPEDRKFEYACDLSLALGFLALSQGDPTVFSIFPGEGPRHQVFSHRSRLQEARDFLASSHQGGRFDLPAACAACRKIGEGRSATFVILSDLLFPDREVREALKEIRRGGGHALLVKITGPSERSLPEFGDDVVRVRDSESGAEARITIDAESRRQYAAAREAHRRRLQSFCFASRTWFAEFQPDSAGEEDYLERFLLQQLPGMGFLRGKV